MSAKEHPILMSGPMVRAIIAGTKTETRRLIIPQPEMTPMGPEMLSRDVAAKSGYSYISDVYGERLLSHRYGKSGDLLWVRENSAPDFPKEFSYYDNTWKEVPVEFQKPEHVLYQATTKHPEMLKWKPSIHMPRWACRILLRNRGVTAEKLIDITNEGAIAEGIEELNMSAQQAIQWGNQRYRNYEVKDLTYSDPISSIASYRSLWQSINGQDSWATSVLVWVIKFEVLEIKMQP